MERKDNLRKEAEAADETGLVANEEAIDSADLLTQLRVSYPADTLRRALPATHGAHQSIHRLRDELAKPAPRRAVLEGEVNALRSVRELEAVIANWWDSPITQRIVDELTRAGL